MKKLLLLFAISMMAIVGCEKGFYDDTKLKDDINNLQTDVEDLKDRVAALEEWCDTANGNISSLQSIIQALEDSDYITDVTPLIEGGKEIGYIISFKQSNPITVLHGTNGQDGTDGTNGQDGVDGSNGSNGQDGLTPNIGAKKDVDGEYYWTIHWGDSSLEDWLLDKNGNKIRTTGDKGDTGGQGDAGNVGESGITPVLSVEEFEGQIYWKVNGVWLLDVNGNKIPANGNKGDKGDQGDTGATGDKGDQGDTGATGDKGDPGDTGATGDKGDQGDTGATGDKGDQGDTGATGDKGDKGDPGNSIFLSVDHTSDPMNVIFTLLNGDKITIPKVILVTVAFDSEELFVTSSTVSYIPIIFPSTLKKEDYTSIVAKITNENGTGIDIKQNSRSFLKPYYWSVEIIEPTFSGGMIDYSNAKIVLTIPQMYDNSSSAILEVSIIDKSGKEHSVSRSVKYQADNGGIINPTIVNNNANSIDPYDNRLKNTLVTNLGSDYITTVKKIKITGTLNEADFQSLKTFEEIDLSEVTIVGQIRIGTNADLSIAYRDGNALPINAFSILGGNYVQNYNYTLKKIILPNAITTIGNSAFQYCTYLSRIEIPNSVTNIGTFAFSYCSMLSEVVLPNLLDAIKTQVFMSCTSLKNIIIPNSVKEINTMSFYLTSFENITIPSSVEKIDPMSFSGSAELKTINVEWTSNIPVASSVFQDNFSKIQGFDFITIPSGTMQQYLDTAGWNAYNLKEK